MTADPPRWKVALSTWADMLAPERLTRRRLAAERADNEALRSQYDDLHEENERLFQEVLALRQERRTPSELRRYARSTVTELTRSLSAWLESDDPIPEDEDYDALEVGRTFLETTE